MPSLLKGLAAVSLRSLSDFIGDAYRTVVAVRLGEKIYVLHAFQKKSRKGIATPKREVDLIKQRYAEAKELAENE
jgi:phage-related protein